ncbi:hypothetical protein G7Y89_g13459 [Cudoniella acicularis]|uniref:Heterokaryon incompatibility domain-containing protein n=1 Tax=Cudoniella acicularis TaxID=354080 RepID=A0A8H4R9U1_9HELO|nr:hypothetical protein G7Y89_g13459 [Cudoniella acicularis]
MELDDGFYPLHRIASSETPSSPFTYRPFGQAGQIRVLVVNSELSHDGLLQCTLEDLPLTSEHVCLSYTWGKGTGPRRICLNGYQFVIDAVCINQEDSAERNKQVSMMAKIYSQAKLVVVYLGHGMSTITSAVEWAGKLDVNQLRQLVANGQADWKSRLIQSKEYEDFAKEHLKNPSLEVLRGMENLYRLPYWSRAWIKQEVLLNQNIQLYYGGSKCSMADFVAISQSLASIGSGLWNTVCRLDSYRLTQPSSKAADQRILLDLIIQYSTSDCTNFHDHIYAFLSLAVDGKDFPIDYLCSDLELWLVTLSRTHNIVGNDTGNSLCTTGVRLFHTLGLSLEDLNDARLKQTLRALELESWGFNLRLIELGTLKRTSRNLQKSMNARKRRKCADVLTLFGDPVINLVINSAGLKQGASTHFCKSGDMVLRFAPVGNTRDSLLVVARQDSQEARNTMRIVGLGYTLGTEKGFAIGAPKVLLMCFPSSEWTCESCLLWIETAQKEHPMRGMSDSHRTLRVRTFHVDMLATALLIKHFLILKEVWRRGGHTKDFKRLKDEIKSRGAGAILYS